MANQSNLQELHRFVTNQVIEQRTQEMETLTATQRAAAQRAEERERHERDRFAGLKIDVAQLDADQTKRTAEAEKRYRAVETQMMQESQQAPAEPDVRIEIEGSFLPADAHVLTPNWVAAFSSVDEQSKLTAAATLPARDIISGGACKDYWNWASGGGWGCLGSGVGEIQTWIDFGFWFLPTVNKFYSIMPLFRFRGFYIVQADDGFWDCKHARTVVSAWTNVYQYNWKGWNSVNVLDVSNDNINVNNRFDTDRYTYNSYLLGGGDWAWIQCTIGLYARAQGGGSYVRNDFAEGDANYLCVPQVWVV